MCIYKSKTQFQITIQSSSIGTIFNLNTGATNRYVCLSSEPRISSVIPPYLKIFWFRICIVGGCIKTKRHRYTSQRPGMNIDRRPADKPRIDRSSNQSLCSSVGLRRISFVRASEEPFKTFVFDALEIKRAGILLGEPTRRRPVLPRPASPRRPPPCRAPPRPDPPVVRLGL